CTVVVVLFSTAPSGSVRVKADSTTKVAMRLCRHTVNKERAALSPRGDSGGEPMMKASAQAPTNTSSAIPTGARPDPTRSDGTVRYGVPSCRVGHERPRSHAPLLLRRHGLRAAQGDRRAHTQPEGRLGEAPLLRHGRRWAHRVLGSA